MRPYREMPRFLLVREQLSLGWKIGSDLRICRRCILRGTVELCHKILREAGFKAGLID
jgi:hypothetical protein